MMGRMALWPVALVLALLGAAPLWSQEAPRHGLMWNRTGLPLVFPLVIQTDPGRDYFVLLRDAQARTPAMAAFIEGGRFFRVLAPPGTFQVEISYGTDWQGEDRLFGGGTGEITLRKPLTFKVRNFSKKGGHRIDLRGLHSQEASLDLRRLRDCQGYRLIRLDVGVSRSAEERAARPSEEALLDRLGPLALLQDALALDLVRPDREARESFRAALPRWEVRQRQC